MKQGMISVLALALVGVSTLELQAGDRRGRRWFSNRSENTSTTVQGQHVSQAQATALPAPVENKSASTSVVPASGTTEPANVQRETPAVYYRSSNGSTVYYYSNGNCVGGG